MTIIDSNLLNFTTPRQKQVLEALIQNNGNFSATATQLNIARTTVQSTFKSVKKKAALKGYAPEADMVHSTVDPFIVKGISTLYDHTGEIKAQWVKTEANKEKIEEIQKSIIQAMIDEIPRLTSLPKPTKILNYNLCNVYTLTDCHVGALCWKDESGNDWDLEIAEKTLTECFIALINSSPDAKIGVVAQLGDFLHQDNITALTPTSGHLLDSAARFPKIVEIAVKILRKAVDAALLKHEEVIVLMAEGNHDISSSIWLRTLFKAIYENEPRVKVINDVLPYYTYQHGETMIAWHHGHLKKNDHLPLFFAAHSPKIWGSTTKRYAHTGHRHHIEEKEHSGMTVIQHSTLAARDAYAARGGWMSDRQALAITYHRKFGEVGRVTIRPEMIED